METKVVDWYVGEEEDGVSVVRGGRNVEKLWRLTFKATNVENPNEAVANCV